MIFRHGMLNTKLYGVWKGMRQRCNDKKRNNYKHYGKRGISVCKEWDDFIVFYNWAMNNNYSAGLDIDRINNDGNYCPGNCRFVTRSENMNNTRVNRKIFAFGEIKNIKEWSEDDRCKVKFQTLYYRIVASKMKPEIAMSERLYINKNSSSKYCGVRFHKKTGKFLSIFRNKSTRKHLGEFFCEKAAAAMYNVYAYSRLGDKARLNDLR